MFSMNTQLQRILQERPLSWIDVSHRQRKLLVEKERGRRRRSYVGSIEAVGRRASAPWPSSREPALDARATDRGAAGRDW